MGYFIRLGDKTGCGGSVLSATSHYIMDGINVALEGDSHSCGKDKKVYSIRGGIRSMNCGGRLLAGTEDCRTGCSCSTHFIPSLLSATYEGGGGTRQMRAASPAATATPAEQGSAAPSPGSTASTKPVPPAAKPEKTESKPEPLPLPARIFETVNKMDDYEAPDMHYGDLEESQLKIQLQLYDAGVTCEDYSPGDYIAQAMQPETEVIRWCNPYTMEDKKESARILFDSFRRLTDVPYSMIGEYKGLMRKMISHMQLDSGTVFRDPLLDKAMSDRISQDKSANSSLLMIKKVLQKNILWDERFYPLEKKMEFKKEISNTILPKFNNIEDRVNGLGITVHDTWATHITLESLEVNGDRFRAVVHYRIQDHFGLDIDDIKSDFYRRFRMFRVWFVLQRWRKYGYRPFITEMNARKVIEGSRYD
ncbi:MAG: PAAR domain-containing protein [Enterobacteriaceae bacterium]